MCGLNKAASVRIIMAACVMIAMVAVGHRTRMLRQVKLSVLILPFGQNLVGGIEQSSQKDIRNSDRKSEELRYSTCHQRYDAVALLEENNMADTMVDNTVPNCPGCPVV